ncbi:MAG: hypothetical protein JSW54_11780 [Fidelibacterota bacterium]|nr:MAG: hypothetical protein JSW54_11780 [Candidatus Neomarinimicrobiota bacterium]
MTRQRVGLVLFVIAVVWAIAWGAIVSLSVDSALNTYTMEELKETAWAMDGTLMMLWGLFGVPLGALVAGIGLWLHTGAKCSTILISGIGIALSIFVGLMFTSLGHFPLLFGIGGTLILLLFFGTVWFWARERAALGDAGVTAADLRLIGYVFLVITAWFTCGALSQPFATAFEGEAPISPIHIMIFFVLGWLFLFLSYYQSRQLAAAAPEKAAETEPAEEA